MFSLKNSSSVSVKLETSGRFKKKNDIDRTEQNRTYVYVDIKHT